MNAEDRPPEEGPKLSAPPRPTTVDGRRLTLMEMWRALSQPERDELDAVARGSARREAERAGFSRDQNEARWSCEVSKLFYKIRDRLLAPVEWQQEDAAQKLKESIAEDAAREAIGPKKSQPRKGKRPVRGGKDASIREGDA